MDPSWVMPFETFWDRSFMVITWWSCGDLMVNGIIWNYTIPASGVIKHSSILSSIYFDDFPLLNLHQKKRVGFSKLRLITGGYDTWYFYVLKLRVDLRPDPNPWRLGACPRTVDAPNNLKVKGLVGRDFKPPWTLCGLMPYHGLYHLYP